MSRQAVAATLMMLCLAAGCKTLARPVEGPVADPAITAAVRSNLAADTGSNFQQVTVETRNGVVTLTGMVELWAERARAEELAYKPRGVKSVVNNLQVAPPARPQ
jgi:hyperosmotically inducible protein